MQSKFGAGNLYLKNSKYIAFNICMINIENNKYPDYYLIPQQPLQLNTNHTIEKVLKSKLNLFKFVKLKLKNME